MSTTLFLGTVILPDRLLTDGGIRVENGRIAAVGPAPALTSQPADEVVDGGPGYLSPGYIDLHVHGGSGADFMDGTREAFMTAIRAHSRHGTTSIVPTTTVARHEQILAMLETCRSLKAEQDGGCSWIGSRILGVHFYGPYFGPEARGCHPGGPLRPPKPEEYLQYLAFADVIRLATVAPELPGAESFVRACVERGIGTNIGHSHATFEQVEAAIRWGVRHVDHLFCAMSDKARLRLSQAYPMRGGVLEATLYFDELTTEVIADGKHLSADLLRLAYKLKGPDRLALVTDCSRALDMPEGEYVFGPRDGGERFFHRDGVGIMPDGKALASSVRGMDHMVRTFHQLTGVPLPEVVRMASLTPARIIGMDQELGSLEPGKRADTLLLDEELNVQRVFIGGREFQM